MMTALTVLIYVIIAILALTVLAYGGVFIYALYLKHKAKMSAKELFNAVSKYSKNDMWTDK